MSDFRRQRYPKRQRTVEAVSECLAGKQVKHEDTAILCETSAFLIGDRHARRARDQERQTLPVTSDKKGPLPIARRRKR
jgi:hypothetical protein